MKPWYTHRVLLMLAVLVMLPSCSWYLQDQIDEQRRRLDLLQQQTQQLQKSQALHQANTNNEIETLRANVQGLSGRIEEQAYGSKQELAALRSKLDLLIERQGAAQRQAPAEGAGTLSEQREAAQPSGTIETPTDSQAMYDQAYSAFKRQQFPQARALFEKFLAAYPKSELVDNAQYWIGSSYYKEQKYEEAIDALDNVIKQSPKGNKTPDALFLQAMAFTQLNDALTAQILLEQLLQSYPNSPAAAEGKKKYDELKQQAPP